MDRSLGHYRIIEHLGSGAMGDVYLAQDKTLKRRVALKILPPDLAEDHHRLQRFRREAEALAALNHPNIVTIHSVEQAEGRHFLTMEHVEGGTLAEAIPPGGLSARRFFELAVPLAGALAAAHDRGIIHRDLKPGNVMVARDGTVKVVDFGLAKPAAQAGPEDATQIAPEPLTQAGGVVGTYPYMSPEQLEGKSVDGRSDVFSLGVVLYEMATGKRPFAGSSSASLIAAIMSSAPIPVDELRAELPHHLARIVRHCLEKDPSHRFQTARDVYNELLDLRDEVGHRTAPPAAPPEPARRHSPRLATAVAAALLLLLLGSWVLWRFLPARGPSATPLGEATVEAGIRKIVVLPFDDLGPAADTYFAGGITDEITSRLAAVGGLGVISRTTARHYEATHKTLREIAAELDVGYVLEGSVRWSAGGTVRVTPTLFRASDGLNLWGEVYDRRVEDIFDVQSEIAHKVVHRLGVALLDAERAALGARPTANLAAYQAFLRARHHAAQPHFSVENWTKVLEAYREAVQLDPDYAQAWAELARAHARFYYLMADHSPERRGLARDALTRASELAPHSPEVHLARGYYLLWIENERERALAELQRAENRLPNSAELLTAKATLLRQQGRWFDSQRAFERAFELSPREAALALELAYAYWPTRQYEKALAACEQTIALGPDPGWQAWAHLTKAFTYWSWKGAVPEGRAALELVPVDHEWSTWAWFWQELYEKNYAQVLQRLAAVPDGWIRTKIAARPVPLLAGLVHDALGEPDRSREQYEAARAALEAESEDFPEDPRLHGSLGIAYAALGRREEAHREGRRAMELFPLEEDAFYGIPYVLDMAFIHTLLGEDGPALDLIELLLRQPSWISPAFLEADPRWDRLRAHPRFAALVEAHRPG